MLSQPNRDEQAVTIATTLALFLAVTLVGAIILAAEAAAVVVSGRYLLRHRRP